MTAVPSPSPERSPVAHAHRASRHRRKFLRQMRNAMGDPKRRAGLQRKYAASRGVQLDIRVKDQRTRRRVRRQLKDQLGRQPNPAQLQTANAERAVAHPTIHMADPVIEPITNKLQPKKRPGEFRNTCNFGPEGRLRQQILHDIMKPAVTAKVTDRAVNGGRDAVVEDVISKLKGGTKYALELDVAASFDSHSPKRNVRTLIPVPWAWQKYLFVHMTSSEGSVEFSHIRDMEARLGAGERPAQSRKVLPQGGKCSNFVQALVAEEIRPLIPAQDDAVLLPHYSDNYLVMGKSRSSVAAVSCATSEAFRVNGVLSLRLLSETNWIECDGQGYFNGTVSPPKGFVWFNHETNAAHYSESGPIERLPEGRVRAQCVKPRRVCDGFEYVGYWFRHRKGETSITIPPSKRQRFRDRIRRRFGYVMLDTSLENVGREIKRLLQPYRKATNLPELRQAILLEWERLARMRVPRPQREHRDAKLPEFLAALQQILPFGYTKPASLRAPR